VVGRVGFSFRVLTRATSRVGLAPTLDRISERAYLVCGAGRVVLGLGSRTSTFASDKRLPSRSAARPEDNRLESYMGQWISVEAMLAQHRKARMLKVHMGLSDQQVVGGLALFWSAVRMQAPDGDTTGWSNQEIGLSAGFEGEEAERFGAELKSCGWIDSNGHVHDWMEHSGRYCKDAERMRNYRKCKRDVRERSCRVTLNTREQEKEKEQDIEPTPLSGEPDVGLVGLSPNRDPERVKNLQDWQDGFRQFWEAYPSRPNSSKKQALKVWMGFCPKDYSTADDLFTSMMGALEDSSKEWKGRETDKIPHHVVWLRRELWRNDAQ